MGFQKRYREGDLIPHLTLPPGRTVYKVRRSLPEADDEVILIRFKTLYCHGGMVGLAIRRGIPKGLRRGEGRLRVSPETVSRAEKEFRMKKLG